MATKDWIQTAKYTWRRKNDSLTLITDYTQSNISYGVEISLWETYNQPNKTIYKDFKTKAEAISYAKNYIKKMISFQLPRAEQGIKYVRITLNSMDTYNIEFIKMVKGDIKVIKKVDGVYDDQLQEIFTRETGLNTHL